MRVKICQDCSLDCSFSTHVKLVKLAELLTIFSNMQTVKLSASAPQRCSYCVNGCNMM